MKSIDYRKWEKVTELIDEGRRKHDPIVPLEIDSVMISILAAQSETVVLLEDIKTLLIDVLRELRS